MKIYLCNKECPCGLFSEMLQRLTRIGIEPNICDDDPEGTYLEYSLPQGCGTVVAERKFNIDLFQGTIDTRRPCIICCGRGYDEAQERVCNKCGEHLLVCESCEKKERMTLVRCPTCTMVTQDEVNATRWQSKSIKEIIPELLDGHRLGMNLRRLTQRLESVCGRKLDQAEVNQALSSLVQEGVIKGRGRG